MAARILVVEDERIVARDLCRRLETQGYVVVGNESEGRAALATAEREHPDLVLMDIGLDGEMDGVETADRVRKMLGIPVVFLTAYSDRSTLARAKITHPFGYVLKPFEEREVVTAIEMALHSHGLEKALRESEERYRAVVANLPDFIVIVRDGRIVYTNKGTFERMGYTPEEILDQPMFRFIAPEFHDKARANLLRRMQGEQVEEYELDLFNRSGRRIRVIVRGTMITYDGAPTPLLVLTDVSDRIQAAEQLAKEQRLLRTLIDNTPDCIYAKDLDGKYFVANKAMARLAGTASEAEILGKMDRDLFPKRIAESLEEQDAYILKHGAGVANHEELFLDSHENFVWMRSTKVPFRNEKGEIIGVIGISRDFTEQKKAQEGLWLAQKNESFRVLAGGVAHDFNNLLVGVLGQNGIALSKLKEGDPARVHLEKAILAAQRMADLTRQMVTFAGQTETGDEMQNANQLVRASLPLFAAAVPKRIALDVSYGDDHAHIFAEAGLIQQALMNLILNAAESYGNGLGTVSIHVGTARIEDPDIIKWQSGDSVLKPGRFVIFRVVDQGCGISEQILPKIFEPFFSTRGTGKGLGLAAVVGILHRYGGGIKVESTVGQGSIMTIALPLQHGIDWPRWDSPSKSREGAAEKTLLVIDDEEGVRDVAVTYCEMEKIKAVAVEDGLAGIGYFSRHWRSIGVVVLDVTMPGLTMEETFSRLCGIDPHVRIFLSSGFPAKDIMGKFIGNDNIVGFIPKPWEMKHMVGIVKPFVET
ncbi:MAG: PAS domain S-box protein [Ignavibacteriales bacterium]|nr:PAS domain S-box protein [Ignavibacteriales bacterium]